MRRRTPVYLLIAWAGLVALQAPGAAVAGAAAGHGASGHGAAGHAPPGFGTREQHLDDAYTTREYDDIRRLRQHGDILPLERILQQARRQRDGRVLETYLERERDRYIYNVEMVDDKGRVWEMELDAATGEVLENRQED
jgi:hypothetical protein